MEEKMDLRIQKTYLALHNAFTVLLEEKRFEELTVNELCDKAMIRRTTFYKHFADKYEYFTFYIREIVSTFHDQLAPDVLDGEADAYFLHMTRELLRFLHRYDRMVRNIKMSSMFPLLLSILLAQITEDVSMILHRAYPGMAKNAEKRKGIAAFYAGGLVSTYFHLMQEDTPVDEALFLEIIQDFTQHMTSGCACMS